MNKVDCIHIVDGYCVHPKTDPNADLHLRKCLLTISPRMTCVHKEPTVKECNDCRACPHNEIEGLEMAYHGGDEYSGGVFVIETRAPAGTELESHVHKHGHVSVLVSGTARVTIEEQTQELTGYQTVTIPANTWHSVEAVTDVIWLCLWSNDVAPKQEAEEFVQQYGNERTHEKED